MNQKPTQVQSLQAQLRFLSQLLTAIIRKHGAEQIIYLEGKSPGIELALTAEDLKFDDGTTMNCESIPDGQGGVTLRLAKVATQ
jgi:hypothetical protein